MFSKSNSRALSTACRAGTGVLDVAGGKGELAFELLNLNDIPATVLEPRPLDLSRQAKWLQVGHRCPQASWPLAEAGRVPERGKGLPGQLAY